ncbi:MAG: hypothetical protein MUF52_15595 [Syntrophobacteraceae bacterium]|jgi:hypothetical protein|nr:hypothetical protein [Syntrophobacteraceae bacterium]
MKAMRQNLVAVAVMMGLVLAAAWGSWAEDSMDTPRFQRARMEAVVDQYIQSREAKHAMLDSRSGAVKSSARFSCEKADFCRQNRERLVNGLLAGGYEPRSEQVFPYLQREYFRAMEAGVLVKGE